MVLLYLAGRKNKTRPLPVQAADTAADIGNILQPQAMQQQCIMSFAEWLHEQAHPDITITAEWHAAWLWRCSGQCVHGLNEELLQPVVAQN